MKKVFSLAAIALFTLASCSSDDSSSNAGTNTQETVLLRKMVSNDETNIYNYDNENRVISITDPINGGGSYFTYAGNLITKVEIKSDEGNLIARETYEYDSNQRLTAFIT